MDNKNKWIEVDTIVEPNSKIAVQINRRDSKFTMQVSLELAAGKMGRFIPIPCEGPFQIEDIVRALVKAAREKVEELQVKYPERKDKKSAHKPRREQKGLSQLARDDATDGGHDYVGPTARRKTRLAEAKAEAKKV